MYTEYEVLFDQHKLFSDHVCYDLDLLPSKSRGSAWSVSRTTAFRFSFSREDAENRVGCCDGPLFLDILHVLLLCIVGRSRKYEVGRLVKYVLTALASYAELDIQPVTGNKRTEAITAMHPHSWHYRTSTEYSVDSHDLPR